MEKPPRNLQPLLRNPVMAALQSVANHTLQIRPGSAAADSFEVAFPDAGVSGSAKPLRPGLYEANLTAAGQQLACKFRLDSDGKRLILYLTDEPFHQITYQKK